MGRTKRPLLDSLHWLSSPGTNKKGVLEGYHVAFNKMALKIVIDAGKLNRAVHCVGDPRWLRDGWSAVRVTVGLT